MMTFEDALRQQLEAQPRLRRRGQKILAVLNSKPSAKRTRIVERLRKHTLASFDDKTMAKITTTAGDPVGIDWSKVNWPALIDKILDILLKLLPLFIGG